MIDKLARSVNRPPLAAKQPKRDLLSIPQLEATLTRLAASGDGNHDHPIGFAPTMVDHLQLDARCRALLEQIPAVTFFASLDNGANELYVSRQIETLLGFSQREWLENPVLWFAQLHPDDRARWQADFAKTCTFGIDFRSEYRFLSRDGRVVWVLGQAKVVRDDSGHPLFLLGMAYDITEQKRAEEAQRKANDELEQRVRERTAELIQVNAALEDEIAERRRAEEERRHFEEALRQSQKMEAVGKLAGGVAHDFNNMLTVITGYSELMLTMLDQHDPLRDPIEHIRKAGERSAALTRQLLAFSRKQVLAPVVLDLNELVTNLEKMLRRLIGEDVNLVMDLERGLRAIKFDPGQLEQVLINLVVNARDAMPTGGQLIVTTANADVSAAQARANPDAREGPYSMLGVRDTGCGMDTATRARVFEPFFTTKGVGKGTGLGLSTAYGVITQSGGFIDVESEPGQGAFFKIYLPAVAQNAVIRQPRPSWDDMPHGTETVLLVEDEDVVRDLARCVLKLCGYQVLEAGNAGEALTRSEKHPATIDLLLTDVVMPQISGRELAERLAPLRPDMKVLFMSGYTDDAVLRHGLESAKVPFLPKPFTPQSLARKLRAVLDSCPST
jgi:PAS domain S-box-containing protein